jgi:hypothetical protein
VSPIAKCVGAPFPALETAPCGDERPALSPALEMQVMNADFVRWQMSQKAAKRSQQLRLKIQVRPRENRAANFEFCAAQSLNLCALESLRFAQPQPPEYPFVNHPFEFNVYLVDDRDQLKCKCVSPCGWVGDLGLIITDPMAFGLCVVCAKLAARRCPCKSSCAMMRGLQTKSAKRTCWYANLPEKMQGANKLSADHTP